VKNVTQNSKSTIQNRNDNDFEHLNEHEIENLIRKLQNNLKCHDKWLLGKETIRLKTIEQDVIITI
jgi:hypothetical protein